MPSQPINVEPMTSVLGAEVSGIDLAEPLDESELASLYDIWVKHKVLFFRDQELTPEQHKAFAANFGEFQAPGFVPTLPDYPEVKYQEQPNKTGVEGNIVYHSDDLFLDVPSKASVLYALDVPERGGDTVWVDMQAAYDALSDTMKDVLSRLTAVNIPMADMRTMVSAFGAEAFAKAHKKTKPAEHPVLKTHPETGRTSLNVNPLNTIAIAGMSNKESDLILNFLFEHSQQADFQVRFSWRKGSVAFWDNRCTMHRGMPNFTRERRLMHRVAIAGTERPYYRPPE